MSLKLSREEWDLAEGAQGQPSRDDLRAEISRLTKDLKDARDKAIEECAQVSERLFLDATDTDWDEGVNTAKREIAKSIRSLSTKGK